MERLDKSNPIAQKLRRVLGVHLDNADTQDALSALEFYKENGSDDRKHLKGHVEQEMLSVHSTLLSSFGLVHDALGDLAVKLNTLQDEWNDMQNKLKMAYKNSAQVLKHTQDLQAKSEQLTIRKAVATAFVRNFTLTDEEKRLLTTNAQTVDSLFFDALSHLQQIRQDCQVLLVAEHHNSAIEIMQTLAMFEETAYDKLFRWVQAECRLMRTEAAEVTIELKKGINAMQDISTNRKSTLVKSFYNAMSVGGPGGYPRPIEFYAHDAVRYMGDMLAWVHQASVGEREMLLGLFGLNISTNFSSSIPAPIPSTLNEMEEFQAHEEVLLHILDQNLRDVILPLKARVISVLDSGLGSITAYKVANLVQFYGYTVSKIIGNEAELTCYLHDAADQTFELFFQALSSQAVELLRFVQKPSSDLQPSPTVMDTVSQLKEIVLSYDGSMVSQDRRDSELEAILKALLEPLLNLCSMGASQLPSLESAIYMVNCLTYIQTVLGSFSHASDYLAQIERDLETQTLILVQEQYSQIIRYAGMADLFQNMQSASKPLALNEQTNSKVVRYTLSQLDHFLVTVPVETADTLNRILSAKLAHLVASRGFKRFIESYRFIVDQVMDPTNKYEFPSSMIPRSAQEVETLLSLDS